MGMYMYPITINREPQKVSYNKEFPINNPWLDLKELRQYITENEIFYIDNNDLVINVSGHRMETEEETNQRVMKEETYMENYNKYHNL